MKRLHLLMAAALLPLLACTAEEPGAPAAGPEPPAAGTPALPATDTEPGAPPVEEASVEPVEDSAALDDTGDVDEVDLALNEPVEEGAQEDAPSSRFESGKHYRVLTPTQPTSSPPDQVEVAEIFWYGCGHCYSFEPFLAKWQETAPSYINFVRIPAVWNDDLRMHARAFYTAQALDKLEELHTPLFRAMHVENKSLATEDELAAFFAQHGVEEEQFRDHFRSFDVVETKLRRADTLNRRYGVRNVPTVVINGKYVTNGEMAGGFEALIAVIEELAEAENE